MADETEHEIGTMDVTQQEKTFAGFLTVSKWVVIGIIAILVFLAIFRT